MKETSSLWNQITPSEYPWEREALAFIREGLPDHEPYRAWANLEFVSEDGTIHEVDLLVLSPKGLFLVEIKSWDGTLSGDATTWVLHRAAPDQRDQTIDSPLLLANRKARKLASLLKRQKAAGTVRFPFVEPLVFLSNPNLRCKLTGAARQGVWQRDQPGLGGGIVDALKRFDPADLIQAGKTRVDRPVAKAVSRAVAEAGIRPTQRSRRAGDYVLQELLSTGPNYQDWLAHRATHDKVRRRVRLYPFASASGPAARARLERAARHEVEALEALDHPGLLKPQHSTSTELGLVLVFEHDPKAVRLDHFLRDAAPRLGFEDRLTLVRQIAETLRSVHAKRVFHRALSPQSILVWNPDAAAPALRILNWQTAAYEPLSTSTSAAEGLSGTSHLDDLVDDATRVYAAPEALTVPDASPETLDVFSLGALAYFIHSGKPPAPTVFELYDSLRSGKGLQLSAAVDGASSHLSQLIQLATHPEVDKRLQTVAEFLDYLDLVEEELTRPEQPFAPEPLEARAGDRLQGGFLVKKRLGKGSTSVVFRVEKDDHEAVLKLALDGAAEERLRSEAEVVRLLDHERIVRFRDTVAVGDRFGLLLERAGDETVAGRLRQDGRLDLELLQRFGEDLLAAAGYLEKRGVPHRDIKPDNLGVAQAGRNDELHLILFDFSLSRTPAENVFAGTKHYLDPFLGDRRPRRWDLQAERFAAAVTLYEMATGALPRWGDGKTHPGMLDKSVEATLDAELLDAAVRAPLTGFFQQALRRNPRQRFDNAEEMLAAWRSSFALADRPVTTITSEEHPDDLAAACARARLDTSVSLLHLSTRAVNALERARVDTVQGLLRLSSARIRRLRGVGSNTRRELQQAIDLLTARLGPQPVDEEAPVSDPVPSDTARLDAESRFVVLSLDPLLKRILPPAGAKGESERRVLEALFGLSAGVPRPASHWPSQTEVAEALGLTRARVSQVLVKARQRWERTPSLSLLRDDVAKLLSAQGGAASIDELFVALLATRGSAQGEPLRTLHAAAALRAATEVEENLKEPKEPRWIARRSRDRVFLALTESDGATLLDYVDALGRKADELAGTDPLPSPQRALEVLLAFAGPRLAGPWAPERLLRLATAASSRAALSSRLEIYPRGLPPERALRLAFGALLSGNALTEVDLRERIVSRFPEAAPLPLRPPLDDLLREVGLVRNRTAGPNGQGAYTLPEISSTSFSTATSRHRRQTTLSPQPPEGELPPDKVDAHLFEERLLRAVREGAFLALLVEPGRLLDTESELTRRFPVDPVSLEERWLAAMQSLARDNDVDWDFVLQADALPPDHPDALKLRDFAKLALDSVEATLASSPRTLLLSRAGLLARYGQMSLIDRLRDRVSRRPAPGETGLHGVWLLLPADASTNKPQIDGTAVPVLTRAQWSQVPRGWIENLHRG